MTSIFNFFLLILQLVNRNERNELSFPLCKNTLFLPVEAVENLPNNLYAIHMLEVENAKKVAQYIKFSFFSDV